LGEQLSNITNKQKGTKLAPQQQQNKHGSKGQHYRNEIKSKQQQRAEERNRGTAHQKLQQDNINSCNPKGFMSTHRAI
jgi:hypothetical protein